VKWRGAQRRTEHPNIKYHQISEEVRKEIISIYHIRTKQQIADSPSQKNLWNKVQGKHDGRIEIRINIEQNTLLHQNEGV